MMRPPKEGWSQRQPTEQTNRKGNRPKLAVVVNRPNLGLVVSNHCS
jgi:hypothetical protein